MASEVEPSAEGADVPQLDDGISRGRVRRAAPLVGLGARAAGEAVVAGLRRKEGQPYTDTAERYAELLGRSKGALMKAGQMLSFVTIGPAVPSEFQTAYQTTLACLRDDAPPMSPELARTVLERELGRRTVGVFAEFDWEPLAAASIGQVHAARLRDGRAVAVKIQYPGVADAIRADLKNTQLLATFLDMITCFSRSRVNVDIRAVAREMGARIVEELDYKREAANQAEFARCYRRHPFIHVPEVIAELSTARVLTQELCEGRGWNAALEADQELRDCWAEAIWRFVYGSHARFCLMNVDTHPGNYVFHDDGGVSFLDFGCVKRYRRERADLITAIASEALRGDALGTWRLCVEGGLWRASDPVGPEEVLAWWREPFRYLWDEQPFTITREHAASWIERRLSPSGPSANALRQATIDSDYSAWPRVEIGLVSMLGALRASNQWGTIWAEYAEDADPVTSMGKLDRAYFEDRKAAGGG